MRYVSKLGGGVIVPALLVNYSILQRKIARFVILY